MANVFALMYKKHIKKIYPLCLQHTYKSIKEWSLQYSPINSLLLHQFPQKELRGILKIPCPITQDQLLSPNGLDIIRGHHKLSKYLGKKDPREDGCKKCKLRAECKEISEDKGFGRLEFQDIQIILHSLYNSLPEVTNPKQQITEDPTISGADPIIDSNINIIEEKVENVHSEISFLEWNSALVILQIMENICEDIANYDSIACKTYINQIICELPKMEIERAKGEREDSRMDSTEELINLLDQCKNRQQRRRVLAAFNKQLGMVWTQNILPHKLKEQKASFMGASEGNLFQDTHDLDTTDGLKDLGRTQQGKVTDRQFVPELGKYVNKNKLQLQGRDAEEARSKGLTYISRKRGLEAINKYEITKRFEVKTNLDREGKRIQEKQKYFSPPVYKQLFEANLKKDHSTTVNRLSVYFDPNKESQQKEKVLDQIYTKRKKFQIGKNVNSFVNKRELDSGEYKKINKFSEIREDLVDSRMETNEGTMSKNRNKKWEKIYTGIKTEGTRNLPVKGRVERKGIKGKDEWNKSRKYKNGFSYKYGQSIQQYSI